MARLAKLVFTVCMRACVPHVGLDASRFPVGIVKEVMKSVLKQKLAGTSYNTEVTKEIAEIIRNKLKGALGVGMNGGGVLGDAQPGVMRCAELGLARYKYMVQVVIGEQKGEGVR